MLLAQLLAAGTYDKCSLEATVKRELNRQIDKANQKSDWRAALLSDEQLRYAALDAAVLVPLFASLSARIKKADLERTAALNGCLPAIVSLAAHGVAFDSKRWKPAAETAKTDCDHLWEELDRIAPPKQSLSAEAYWNWNSHAQVKEALALAGFNVPNTQAETLAGIDHPLAKLFCRYREAQYRSSHYGEKWLGFVAEDSRIYADWKQCGAKTGRMSCRRPSLQNLPRSPLYRRCFHAPPGRLLVKADYSQIELRITAKAANETRMIEAYHRGDDLHVMTAQRMTGRSEVTSQERQMAKPVNFGLIYGMGVTALVRKASTEYGVDITIEDAQGYRAAFFKSYPAIQAWHNDIEQEGHRDTHADGPSCAGEGG